jgi:putative ABC transport system ATP-binding protein
VLAVLDALGRTGWFVPNDLAFSGPGCCDDQGNDKQPSVGGAVHVAVTDERAEARSGSSMAVRAVRVWKIFGRGEARVTALRGVSVELQGGEFAAIMGPSGSGKSTLMHCLAGLDEVTRGEVYIGATRVSGLGDGAMTRLRRDKMGFIFQQFNLLPTLTARENILLPLSIAGRQPDRPWYDAVIDAVGLRDRLEHRPSQLSGGQQQRVACARALISRPEVIFADEPTGNLDSQSSAEVLGFLRRSVDDFGQTIVMVTHDPNAASYADRVLFLADGEVVSELLEPTPELVLDAMKALDVAANPRPGGRGSHRRGSSLGAFLEEPTPAAVEPVPAEDIRPAGYPQADSPGQPGPGRGTLFRRRPVWPAFPKVAAGTALTGIYAMAIVFALLLWLSAARQAAPAVPGLSARPFAATPHVSTHLPTSTAAATKQSAPAGPTSAAATLTSPPAATLTPIAITTISGSTGSGQPVSNLAVKDLSGTTDGRDRYFEFIDQYAGYLTYEVPATVSASSITRIQVRVNYRGPATSTQTWTFKLYDWRLSSWVSIGTNADAPEWGAWMLLRFNAPGTLANYVSPTSAINLQLVSNNDAGAADIDYAAVVLTTT